MNTYQNDIYFKAKSSAQATLLFLNYIKFFMLFLTIKTTKSNNPQNSTEIYYERNKISITIADIEDSKVKNLKVKNFETDVLFKAKVYFLELEFEKLVKNKKNDKHFKVMGYKGRNRK